MTTKNIEISSPGIEIRRGRVKSVDLFEVKEGELDQLEKGWQETQQDLTYTNLLFSAAITSIGALATSDFKWETAKIFFILIAVVGVLLGSYCFFRWRRNKSSITKVISTIRGRITRSGFITV